MREFKLICAPKTQAVEAEINEILKNRPDAKIGQGFGVPYFKKRTQMDCPKCGGYVIQKDEEGRHYLCARCNREFDQEEYSKLCYETYREAGSLFVVPVILGD